MDPDLAIYDDPSAIDPSSLATLGVPDNSPGFNWAGLGNFVNDIAPVALGVTSAIIDKPINASGSTSSGQAISISAGQLPINAVAGLSAAPLTATTFGGLSTTTLLIMLAGGALVVYALVK